MRLLLSSDTLPGSSMDELLQACRRRALAGLELSVGVDHGHGLDEAVCPLHHGKRAPSVPDEVSSVEWLRLPHDASSVVIAIWSAAAHRMQAGVLLHDAVPDPPQATKIALIHGSAPDEVHSAVEWALRYDAATCWDVTLDALTEGCIESVLDQTFGTLAHIRLPGSGPEADHPASEGVGLLLAQLALRGYAGTVGLIPSGPAHLREWEGWLLQKRGWGCGTAADKAAKRAARMQLTSEQA